MDEKVSFEHKKALIKNQACFRVLTEEEINELTELFLVIHYKAGDVIVTEGDHVESVFIIVSGTAEVLHTWIDNGAPKTEKLADLGPKQTIGLSETGLYSLTGLRTATVVATSNMVLICLNVTLFNGFVLSHSNISKVLHAVAAKKDTLI